MSIRRAVEFNIKTRLESLFENSKYKVIESLRQSERPIPAIVIVAGDAKSIIDGQEWTQNYEVPVKILVLSSVDDDTIDDHNYVIQSIINKMNEQETRTKSLVKNLYLYNIHLQAVGEDNGDRKIGTVIDYSVVCNFAQ